MRLFMIAMLLASMALGNAVLAQEAEDEEENGESVTEEEVMDEIVVTGSRIRRDEFSSAAPVQIIDGQTSRELGLIDTAALLQSATQATGTQVDSTFTHLSWTTGRAPLRSICGDWVSNGCLCS